MDWQIIVALVIALPIILLPTALIWYINIEGIKLAIKEWKMRHHSTLLSPSRLTSYSGKQV